MEVYYTGVIIAVSTFLIIGIFHPIVMKTEYYTGTRMVGFPRCGHHLHRSSLPGCLTYSSLPYWV